MPVRNTYVAKRGDGNVSQQGKHVEHCGIRSMQPLLANESALPLRPFSFLMAFSTNGVWLQIALPSALTPASGYENRQRSIALHLRFHQ